LEYWDSPKEGKTKRRGVKGKLPVENSFVWGVALEGITDCEALQEKAATRNLNGENYGSKI